jgi:hypothetical protein
MEDFFIRLFFVKSTRIKFSVQSPDYDVGLQTTCAILH